MMLNMFYLELLSTVFLYCIPPLLCFPSSREALMFDDRCQVISEIAHSLLVIRNKSNIILKGNAAMLSLIKLLCCTTMQLVEHAAINQVPTRSD